LALHFLVTQKTDPVTTRVYGLPQADFDRSLSNSSITNTESVNTQVNTIIHEIAHELLHKGKGLGRRQKEIQAEGVAYVVTQHFGMENKSLNYLALYGADYRKIMGNLKSIAGASREIIGFLEERMAVPSAA